MQLEKVQRPFQLSESGNEGVEGGSIAGHHAKVKELEGQIEQYKVAIQGTFKESGLGVRVSPEP